MLLKSMDGNQIAGDTEHAERLRRQGQSLIDLGRSEEAIPVVRQALAGDPDSARGWCLLGLACSNLTRFHEAFEAAERATALAPDDEWAHRLRSYVLEKVGENGAALQAAR